MGKLNVLPGEVLSGVIQKLTEDVEIRYTNKQEDICNFRKVYIRIVKDQKAKRK